MVTVITGAGRGIGRATAELFAERGARVVLCSRTSTELTGTVNAINEKGGTAIGRKTDIGSPHQAEAFVNFSLRHFGTVDVLINNAGILGPRVPLTEYPVTAWNEVVRINLSATYYMTRAVARIMTHRGTGCIVNVTSTVGRQGRKGWGAYAVSKFGVEGLTQVFAEELREFGVRTFALNPGATRTRMRADAYPEEDPAPLQSPTIAAEALLRLVLYGSLEQSGRSFDLSAVPGGTRN